MVMWGRSRCGGVSGRTFSVSFFFAFFSFLPFFAFLSFLSFFAYDGGERRNESSQSALS